VTVADGGTTRNGRWKPANEQQSECARGGKPSERQCDLGAGDHAEDSSQLNLHLTIAAFSLFYNGHTFSDYSKHALITKSELDAMLNSYRIFCNKMLNFGILLNSKF
jgi:hypothetical protein